MFYLNRITGLYERYYYPKLGIDMIYSYTREGVQDNTMIFNHYSKLEPDALNQSLLDPHFQDVGLYCLTEMCGNQNDISMDSILKLLNLYEPPNLLIKPKLYQQLCEMGYMENNTYVTVSFIVDEFHEIWDLLEYLEDKNITPNLDTIIMNYDFDLGAKFKEKSEERDNRSYLILEVIKKSIRFGIKNLHLFTKYENWVDNLVLQNMTLSYDININIITFIDKNSVLLDSDRYKISNNPSNLLPINYEKQLEGEWDKLYITQNSPYFGTDIKYFDDRKRTEKYLNTVVVNMPLSNNNRYILSRILYSLQIRRSK